MPSHTPCSSLAVPGGVSDGRGTSTSALRLGAGQRPDSFDATGAHASSVPARKRASNPSRRPPRALSRKRPVSIVPSISVFRPRFFEGNFLRRARPAVIDAPSPDHFPRRRLQDNGQILWRHRQGRQGCANPPPARSATRRPVSNNDRLASPPVRGSYLRKYLSGRAPALTFLNPARLRRRADRRSELRPQVQRQRKARLR